MVKIKKGGCTTEVTLKKFHSHYKFAGYKIIEEEAKVEYNLDTMKYKEIQELYGKKFDDSPVGILKVDLIERLKKVL